jgi:hypothetical protein
VNAFFVDRQEIPARLIDPILDANSFTLIQISIPAANTIKAKSFNILFFIIIPSYKPARLGKTLSRSF